MGLLTAPTVKRIRISQIQDGGRPPFWEPLYRPILTTFWLIFIKFGMEMNVGPQSLAKFRIFNFWQSYTADRRYLASRKTV